MSRLKSNCSVMFVLPCVLVELMLVRPGMLANCFSSGSATGAGQRCLDLNSGEVDGREIGHRQPRVRHRAEHEDAEHDERGRHRPLDEE
jgi:hypothetical protein